MARKDALIIKTFDGVFGAADPEDIPVGVAAFAQNIEIIDQRGALQGAKGAQEINIGAQVPGVAYKFTRVGDGDIYIYGDGSSIKSVTNIQNPTGSQNFGTVTGYSVSGVEGSGVSDGEAVYFGVGDHGTAIPQWIGKTGAQYTRESALLTRQTGDVDPDVVLTLPQYAAAVEDVVFPWDTKVRIATSLTYDGKQETVLWPMITRGFGFSGDEADFGVETFTIVIDRDPTKIPARVTHINLYAARVTGFSASDFSDEHVLIKSIAQDDAGWSTNTFTFVWDGGTGLSYTQRTDLSEKLEHMDIHWSISCAVGGYHCIAQCDHKDLQNPGNFLFVSLRQKFSMFNWPRDFLTLPTKVNALEGFMGEVYAFSDNAHYVIDPNGPAVTQVFHGMGCISPRSVISTQRGMFFCDKRNIYLHDGRQVIPLANPILTVAEPGKTTTGWLAATHSSDPSLLYDPASDALIVIHSGGGGLACWIYVFRNKHDINDRSGFWYYYKPSNSAWSGTIRGAILGENGELMIVIGNKLFQLFSSASVIEAWEWYSRKFNHDGHDAKYYQSETNATGAPGNIHFSEDGAAYSSSTVSQIGTSQNYEGNINTDAGTAPPWKTVRTMQFKLMGVQDSSVVVKHLRAKRRIMETV